MNAEILGKSYPGDGTAWTASSMLDAFPLDDSKGV
jgi:hypothetical protein